MSPASLDPHNVRMYRRRGRFGLGLSIAALPFTVAGLIKPELLDKTAIGLALDGPAGVVWLIAYVAGALFTSAGLLWRPIPRPELEALGLWLFLGALVTNTIAILVVRGLVGGAITGVGQICFAWVLKARIDDLEEAGEIERRHGSRRHPGEDRRRSA